MNIFEALERTDVSPLDSSIQKDEDWAAIKKAIEREALRLYLEGVSCSQIARSLETSRQTIMSWVIKGGWKIKRDKLRANTEQKTVDKISEIKDRHVKIAKAIQAQMIKNLQDGNLKVSTTDGLKAMEHEAKIIIPENFGNQTIINNDLSSDKLNDIIKKAESKRKK